MTGADVPRPEGRELRAAGLAALAEAGVVALPVHMLLTQSGHARIATGAFVVPFAVAYLTGVLLVCWFRPSRTTPVEAGLLAIAIGLWFGRGDLNREVFSVVVSLLVALRIVTLALRDWRTPIHGDFGVGAAGLGLEVILATGPQEDWKPLLVVVAPLYFAAMLSSRATTVWTELGAGDLEEHVRAGWVRRAFAVTAALVCGMTAAVILGVRGGVFDRVGKWLAPVAAALASLIAFTLSQLARPIFWLVDRLHIDPEKVRQFFERLRSGAAESARRARQPGPTSLWQRVLGIIVFAAVAWALVRLLRRFRPELSDRHGAVSSAGVVRASAIPQEAAPRARRGRRRELPADTVRRWYAEALLLLERVELPKEPSLTPAEYLPEVALVFPACAASFEALTHAYEDVRYGHRSLSRERLDALRRHQRDLVRALSAAPSP